MQLTRTTQPLFDLCLDASELATGHTRAGYRLNEAQERRRQRSLRYMRREWYPATLGTAGDRETGRARAVVMVCDAALEELSLRRFVAGRIET